MYRERMDDLLVASLAALCSSQFVHLCDALLELFVLALFVRVSLVLFRGVWVRGLFCRI
jgi:1-acyl-sn-glycerol-3-phosphate acyltransferase